MELLESRCKFLGASDARHPSKILLEHLSKDGESGLDLYRRYIRETLNLNVSNSLLGEMSDELLGKFYGTEFPLEPPKFFSFDLRSSHDISKLESILGMRIVVLCLKQNTGTFLTLHDRSVYSLLGGRGEPAAGTHYICLSKAGKVIRVYRCPDRMGYDQLEHLASRGYVAKIGFLPESGCFLELFSQLLEQEISHSHDDLCGKLQLVMTDWRLLQETFSPTQLVIVTHLRSSMVDSGRIVKDSFGMISTPPSPPADSKTLCLLQSGNFFLVRQDKVSCLLTPEVRSRYPKTEEMPAPMTGIRAGEFFKDGSKKRPLVHDPPCSCEGCANAQTFSENMAEGGPPLLYKHATSLFDLLRSVGLLNEQNEKLINDCAALSVGSFDVETFTLNVREDAGNEDCLFPYTPVSDKGLPRAVKARMRPVLIGYTDTMMLDEDSNVEIFGGWSEEDEKRTKFKLVGDFADFVLARQDLAALKKLEKLSALFSWVEKYSDAYCSFYREHCFGGGSDECPTEILEDEFVRFVSDMDESKLDEDWTFDLIESDLAQDLCRKRSARLADLAEKAFDSTLFGKIQAALKRLVKVFVVFAFNGQRFDFVVLGSDLTVHYKSLGKHVRMSRDGLAIKGITISGNLHFQEAGVLLSPGTSLDGLGKLVGLDITKFRFPFELLSSHEFLREPQLPRSKEAWASSLTSNKKQPTQEEVDHFIDLYRSEGHSCVGEFLVRYLRLDCLILQRSMLHVIEGYYQLLGVNLIESFKLTISSLSSFGVQVEMFRKKRIGFFFCNNSRVYACLKNGTRGGYVAVHSTTAGRKSDVSEYADLLREQLAFADPDRWPEIAPNLEAYPSAEAYLRACNPHLAPPGEVREPANFIQYLDVNSLYGTAARNSLPFGSGVFFTAVDAPAERKQRRARGKAGYSVDYSDRCSRPGSVFQKGSLFARQTEKQKFRTGAPTDLFAGEEAAFAQYMALSVFPDSVYVYSAFHSSCGQLTFGGSPQAKADLTVVREEKAAQGSRTHLIFMNYHGRYYHNCNAHFEGCPLSPRSENANPDDGFRSNRGRTLRDDSEKLSLARALSSVDGGLKISYHATNSCELFCRRESFLRPSTWTGQGGLDYPCQGYDSLRDMLAGRHESEAVFGPGFRSITAGDLVNKIMHSGNCHDGSTSMGGFVVLTGGRECVAEEREKAFGFCFQRSRVSKDELGPWSLMSAEMLASSKLGLPLGDAKVVRLRDQILLDLLKEPITLSRTSFGNSTECVSLDFFRWLVRERGLREIEIKHFIYFTEKKWLAGFFTGLLQARHDLRKSPDSGLRRNQLKLIVNGFYGFNAIQSTSYSKTSIIVEGSLRRMTQEQKLKRLLPSRGVSVTLLGCTDPTTAGKKKPQLVYGITRWNDDAPIVNTIQVAATILSCSKVLFFSHLLSILRNFDPRKVALLYSDTDSLLLGTTHVELEKCFDGGGSGAAFTEVLSRLLEDPDSESEQSGKLKIENVFESGYFRGCKAYFLGSSVEDGKSMARMRSVPRALHSHLTEEKFRQDPRKNSAVVTYVNMCPTKGLEMVKARQSRSLSVSLNTKLFAMVGDSSRGFLARAKEFKARSLSESGSHKDASVKHVFDSNPEKHLA